MDFLIMFSSLRLLPAHTSVTGSVTDGSAISSSMLMLVGRCTRPPTSILCVAQSSLGTAPWLRT